MAGFSSVVCVGNIVRDIETRTFEGKSGPQEICNLTLAINEKYGGKEVTTYIDVSLFGRQAEIAKQYASKGSQVLIEGRLNQSNWEDKKTGEKRSKISINGDKMLMMGAPKQKAEPSYSAAGGEDDIPF